MPVLIQDSRVNPTLDCRATPTTNNTTIGIDYFNRPNQDPLSGNWTTVSTTDQFAGGLKLINQQVSFDFIPGGARGHATYTAFSWSNDQFGEIMVGQQNGGGCSVILRQTGSSYYCFIAYANKSIIQLYQNQAATNFVIVSASVKTGDIIRAEAKGSLLTMKQNGTVLTSISDSTLSGGNIGIELETNNLVTPTVLFWQGGALNSQFPAPVSSGTPYEISRVNPPADCRTLIRTICTTEARTETLPVDSGIIMIN